MSGRGRPTKSEIILLGLTAVFLCALAVEARARGISYGELVSRTTAKEQQEIIERFKAERATRPAEETATKQNKKKKK